MAGISLEGITKRYRDVVAVQELDLEISDGEIMMLVGPSGCGKTTVLRLIAGLERPDAGTVRFDGRDMSDVAPGERDIAMVFEGYALFPHMAVRENLSFALRLRHTPTEEVDRRVREVAEAMELDHLLQRRPPGLATGEAQHVAVGRAVVRDAPAVLLLDDALSHLDAQQRLEARAEVARLHDELGSQVLDRRDLEQQLAEHQFQWSDFAFDERIVAFGKKTPATVIVTGTIHPVGDDLFDMRCRLLDLRTGQVLARSECEFEAA